MGQADRILGAAAHAWRMVNPWSPMVRDDRGRPVPLYRLDRSWRDQEGMPSEVFARIRRSLLSVTHYRGMGRSPKVLLTFAIVWAITGLWFLRSMPPGGLIYLMLAALYFGLAVRYRWRLPKADHRVLARAILQERRCASCAYDLSAALAEPDGRSVCPECGAAWVLPQTGDRGGGTDAMTAMRLASAMEALGDRAGADVFRMLAGSGAPVDNQAQMEYTILLLERGDREGARRSLEALVRRNATYLRARKEGGEAGVSPRARQEHREA